MEGYPVLVDAVRNVWIKPALLPPSTLNCTPQQNATLSASHAIATQPAGSSPLDHIQAVAQWYVGTRERITQYHHDVSILASRAHLVGASRLVGGEPSLFAQRQHDGTGTPPPQRNRHPSPTSVSVTYSSSSSDDASRYNGSEDGDDVGYFENDTGRDFAADDAHDEATRRGSVVLP